jgi:hypothetical protein
MLEAEIIEGAERRSIESAFDVAARDKGDGTGSDQADEEAVGLVTVDLLQIKVHGEPPFPTMAKGASARKACGLKSFIVAFLDGDQPLTSDMHTVER